MSEYMLDLPIDVTEPIYNYCTIKDLINVACCSKSYYASIKYRLWRYIRIPWETLQQRILPQKQLNDLKYTFVLSFSSRNQFLVDISWKNVATNYEQILKHCTDKLLAIHIDGVIVDKGIKMTLKLLEKLQSGYPESRENDSSRNRASSIFGTFRFHLQRSNTFSEGVDNYNNLNCLNELYLQHCPWLTEDALKQISTITDLRKLTISHNQISSNGFLHIGKLHRLVELNVESTLICDHSLSYISQFLCSLKTLNCGRCNNVTDTGLSHVSKLCQMTNLDISWCTKITDIGFSSLASLVLLKYLKLQGCMLLTDDGIKSIQVCTSLKELSIGCTNTTDVGLSTIGKLKLLNRLIINGCNQVSGNGLLCLSDLHYLKELDLSGRNNIDDVGFSYLRPLTSLRILKIQNNIQLTDSGLYYISLVRSLIELNISGCTNITDRGVKYIYDLKSLQCLSMNECHKVTEKGLGYLSGMPSLRELSIININMSP